MPKLRKYWYRLEHRFQYFEVNAEDLDVKKIDLSFECKIDQHLKACSEQG